MSISPTHTLTHAAINSTTITNHINIFNSSSNPCSYK